MPVKDIIASGDVVFVVGEGGSQFRLRVSSTFLQHVSPVFAALLSGRWQEGRKQNPSQVFREIALKDDNPTALELLLKILYFKHDDAPLTLKPMAIYDFAVVADKYDCVKAVKFVKHAWLQNTERLTFRDCGYLAAACVAFGDSERFRYYTKRLALYYNVSVANTFAEEDNNLPLKALGKMNL